MFHALNLNVTSRLLVGKIYIMVAKADILFKPLTVGLPSQLGVPAIPVKRLLAITSPVS